MEAYLNELSCFPLCESESEVDKRVNDLLAVVKVAHANKFNVIRCADKGISGVLLSEDFSLADFCNKNPRGEKEQLLMMTMKAPFFKEGSLAEERYVLGTYLIEINGVRKDAYGLAAAYLNNSIAINMCSNDYWISHKEYELILSCDRSRGLVYAFCCPNDFESDHFTFWQVKNKPRRFLSSSKKVKCCKLSSDHHGNNVLKEFAENSLFPLPYIDEVVTSMQYSPYCKTFVKDIHVDSMRIDVVLTWTEKGLGMVLQTTARDEVELRQMAEELENKFGNQRK